MNESMTTNDGRCPGCGTELEAGACDGLCPVCLMQGAMTPTAGGTAGGSPPGVPALEAVQAAFPQLEVVRLIGSGGMGAVFLARQPHLDRMVALKVIPAQGTAGGREFAARFEREGRLLARLHHPNIVTIHDSGRAGEFYYLVMEYVEGVTLREAMRASQFTPAEALALVPKICEALQYAHEEGILHRDIKPENILLDLRGRVKLADFGIAKLMGPRATAENPPPSGEQPEAPTVLTKAGAMLGTPRYMAPEQAARPEEVDHRADIYSLGVVIYELLTGELPPAPFAPPSERADVDRRIDAIVQQALERERRKRQQSAAELKTQVEQVTRPGGERPARQPRTAFPRGREPVSRRRLSWIATGVAVLACAGAGYWILRNGRQHAPGNETYGWVADSGQPADAQVTDAGKRWIDAARRELEVARMRHQSGMADLSAVIRAETGLAVAEANGDPLKIARASLDGDRKLLEVVQVRREAGLETLESVEALKSRIAAHEAEIERLTGRAERATQRP